VRMSVRNDTGENLMLVDDAQHCAFALVAVDNARSSGDATVSWATHDCSRWQHGELQWTVLAPEGVYSVDIDFAEPQWHVLDKDGKAVELVDLNQAWFRYRLVYSPPDVELPEGPVKVWLSPLQSAAFNAGGRVD